eukprot:scaffold9828_cov105-Isochrysis_galbana.AAC.6
MATSVSRTVHPPHGAKDGSDCSTKASEDNTITLRVPNWTLRAARDDDGRFSRSCAFARHEGGRIRRLVGTSRPLPRGAVMEAKGCGCMLCAPLRIFFGYVTA